MPKCPNKKAAYRLIVQASPSDNQSWHSLDTRQSLSSWMASAESSGMTTLLARTGRPLTGSRLAFTTSSRGSNSIWTISGAFGFWIMPFRHDYKWASTEQNKKHLKTSPTQNTATQSLQYCSGNSRRASGLILPQQTLINESVVGALPTFVFLKTTVWSECDLKQK